MYTCTYTFIYQKEKCFDIHGKELLDVIFFKETLVHLSRIRVYIFPDIWDWADSMNPVYEWHIRDWEYIQPVIAPPWPHTSLSISLFQHPSWFYNQLCTFQVLRCCVLSLFQHSRDTSTFSLESFVVLSRSVSWQHSLERFENWALVPDYIWKYKYLNYKFNILLFLQMKHRWMGLDPGDDVFTPQMLWVNILFTF